MKKLILMFISLVAITLLVACSGNNVHPPDFDFSIAFVEDLSTQGMSNYRYRVVVNQEVSPSELEGLAMYIAESVKSDKDFNALQIWFFDYHEFARPGRSNHTLGEAIYAPGGSWERANTVTTGNYRTFEFSFNIPDKDWSLRLTPDEAEIFGEWSFVSESAPTANEEFINGRVAYLLDVTVEDVVDVMRRQLIWAHNRR